MESVFAENQMKFMQDYSYVDAHCHLQEYSDSDLESILEQCKEAKLRIFFTNATNINDFDKTIKLSDRFIDCLIIPIFPSPQSQNNYLPYLNYN